MSHSPLKKIRRNKSGFTLIEILLVLMLLALLSVSALTSYFSSTEIFTFTRTTGVDSTVIFESHFGIDAGVGAGRVTGGGAARGTQEWVYKQNTRYLVAAISATAANIISIKLSWYEHTNKN